MSKKKPDTEQKQKQLLIESVKSLDNFVIMKKALKRDQERKQSKSEVLRNFSRDDNQVKDQR